MNDYVTLRQNTISSALLGYKLKHVINVTTAELEQVFGFTNTDDLVIDYYIPSYRLVIMFGPVSKRLLRYCHTNHLYVTQMTKMTLRHEFGLLVKNAVGTKQSPKTFQRLKSGMLKDVNPSLIFYLNNLLFGADISIKTLVDEFGMAADSDWTKLRFHYYFPNHKTLVNIVEFNHEGLLLGDDDKAAAYQDRFYGKVEFAERNGLNLINLYKTNDVGEILSRVDGEVGIIQLVSPDFVGKRAYEKRMQRDKKLRPMTMDLRNRLREIRKDN